MRQKDSTMLSIRFEVSMVRAIREEVSRRNKLSPSCTDMNVSDFVRLAVKSKLQECLRKTRASMNVKPSTEAMTLDEALADPSAFVDGMIETVTIHSQLPRKDV